jgi:cyclic pyranopterin phosphate synthase
MIDAHGRTIEYLRLSLTEQCSLRCVYCRDAAAPCPEAALTAAEVARILGVMVTLGINKVRLTGGEPLMRPDLEEITAAISSTGLIQDLTMTTNAQGLAGRARALKAAGLMRLNISLDSLDPARYREMTGGGDLAPVLAGIDAALAAGLRPVKLNCVVIRGTNDGDIPAFIDLARGSPLDVRFIELMPMGSLRDPSLRVPTEEILAAHGDLQELPTQPGAPAREYSAPGFKGTVGFISAVSKRFCNECNRVRVTADGRLRPCLGDNREIDLRGPLAQGDEALREAIQQGVFHKPEGHHFSSTFVSGRKMNRIGG